MERNDPLVQQIAAEAAEWFTRLQGEDAGTREREQFTEWLLRSPTHIAEYLAISRAWGDSADASDESIQELVSAAKADTTPANVVQLREQLPSREHLPVKRRGFLLAASVLIGTLLTGAVAWQLVKDARAYVTEIGEQRSIPLADGSVVQLNTDSRLKVAFGEQERKLTLSRGEAIFTVARDTTRPFLVTTAQARVRAVGTVFNVATKEGSTAVTVIEGRVAISLMSDAGASVLAELGAGQQAEITGAGEILSGSGPSLERVLAWPERRLVFRGETLAEVVAEFNRYHERPIRIEDPSLAAVRINGVFDASDPHSLIQFLERYENVRTREGSEASYLSR